MKKTILILVMVLGFATIVSAQYKPTSGFDVEVNFRPFNASPIQLDYLKARMFLNETMAIRLGLELSSYSETNKVAIPTGSTNKVEQVTKNSYFVFGLHPGIEMHIANDAERFSPYIGAEIDFTMKSASTDVTGVGNDATKTSNVDGSWSGGSNPAFTNVGLNLLVGADYYFTKHIYMGAEFGFGFHSMSYKDVVTTNVVSGASTSVTALGNSSTTLGVNYNSAIRLGWSF
ncbi:MAG: hypothetical protein ACOYO1_01535 [Bacteroidales bacterium]